MKFVPSHVMFYLNRPSVRYGWMILEEISSKGSVATLCLIQSFPISFNSTIEPSNPCFKIKDGMGTISRAE